MAAQSGKFRMEFNWVFILVSCVLAYVVSAVGMVILFFFKQTVVTRILAAIVIAVAVCSVHYTGMLSAKYYFWADGPEEGREWIKVNTQIVSLASAFLALCLSAIENTYARQRLQNLRAMSRRVLQNANQKTLKNLENCQEIQGAADNDVHLHKMLEEAAQGAPQREQTPMEKAMAGRGDQYLVGKGVLSPTVMSDQDPIDAQNPFRLLSANADTQGELPASENMNALLEEEDCNVPDEEEDMEAALPLRVHQTVHTTAAGGGELQMG
uniref:MHYT domain-containing protein n=1 Tax=Chromera velia CCMP2878 TaxID=1169474 RepID=A0A0G4GWM6_9ALVE|eukprot:Cvel_5296.t1-p1 / transcript=Cvel_5296.t1 / gene=Cvel_5296 / organism=Chromera_velia_CCMP2878 / gene_product=hypothetical protein / transcript_product=hypothetical protein / location=Cvel_scaffold245:37760-38840(+) / protein_length=267 / sequence_SO=supercontig / SO=protein_coding / is_pseudo=false